MEARDDELVLTVLGCSGTYAAPGNACTGYLVQGAGLHVLVDCGPGVLANLQHHVPLPSLDAVLVTHEHPDHCAELGVLQNAWRWAFGLESLPVYGTAGTLAKVQAQSSSGSVEPSFAWHTVTEDDVVELTAADSGPGLTVRYSRTDHPVETLALRIDHPGGASLVFSSDTGADWSLARLGPAPDLVLCEATFLSDRPLEGASHLTCAQAGAMAREVGARQLVITHHWPGDDLDAHRAEAEAAFGAPVDVAEVHARYVVRAR